ncbi:hypothetical protein [Enterococcus sp. DIV0876]|uniref:hypothetical protein n=1 Tax=Enterococcus sp. DIV0876 TaxID=2774633 RepID=UPI003D2FE3CC
MKFKLNIKDKVTEAAEHVYDVMKKNEYVINVAPKGIKVKKQRQTQDTIKWRAKNH